MFDHCGWIIHSAISRDQRSTDGLRKWIKDGDLIKYLHVGLMIIDQLYFCQKYILVNDHFFVFADATLTAGSFVLIFPTYVLHIVLNSGSI
jgi:hypothetical protein